MKKLNVLSLFDGISCGRLAMQKANLGINKYYASEINEYAIKVAKKNYPEIIELGDVRDLNKEMIEDKIDFLIGGSPCQSFSFIGYMDGMSTEENGIKNDIFGDEIKKMMLDFYPAAWNKLYQFTLK